MISIRPISAGPISTQGFALNQGTDSGNVVISSADSGFGTIRLITENATITLTGLDPSGIATISVEENSLFTIATTDVGVASDIGDSFQIVLSASDIGTLTNIGVEAFTISVGFKEGKQVAAGQDVLRVAISFTDIGYSPASGADVSQVVISSQDTGVVIIVGAVETVSNLDVLGNTETWVLNLASGGHSRYTNHNFNSYVRLGTDYYGFSASGIYKLTGKTDAGAPIEAEIITGVTNFKMQTVIPDAYMLMRSDGEMELTTITDETRTVGPYPVVRYEKAGTHLRRVKLAKGVKGITWQYKIANVAGADFFISQLEVTVASSQNRRGS